MNSIPARSAFSSSLTETLYGKEAEAVKPLKCLDDGVSGYTFDLVPLRLALDASASPAPQSAHLGALDALQPTPAKKPTNVDKIIPLILASLEPLSIPKPRLVYSSRSPYEMLQLIQHIGIDLFDAHWAQRASDIGIALNFQFPVSKDITNDVRQSLGHNLYHPDYAFDFSPLAGKTLVRAEGGNMTTLCLCSACSPVVPGTRICHGTDPSEASVLSTYTSNRPAFTRAYLHHLLHTHEMSAHSLLVMHNLTVLDAFFGGVRSVLAGGGETIFAEEVAAFGATYDDGLEVFDEAIKMWREVEMARGKGRLAREKKKQESTLGTEVDVPNL